MEAETLKDIGMIIGGAIIPVVGYCVPIIKEWVINRKNKCKRKTLKKEYVVKDYAIIQQMTELLIHCGADRTYLNQFHNGDHFLPSYKNAIWKISCSHEVPKVGVIRHYRDFQSVLISHVNEYIAPTIIGDSGETMPGVHHISINKKKYPNRNLVLFDVDNMANCYMRQKFIDGGVRFVLTMNLLDEKESVGAVSVEFANHNLTLEQLMFTLGTDEELVSYAERLEYTICY
jgi:hypothetical protein